MSNKRPYKPDVEESNGRERESSPHRRKKRARRQNVPSSTSDLLQKKSDVVEQSSVAKKDLAKKTEYTRHPPEESSNRKIVLNTTPKNYRNETNKSRLHGYNPFKEPSTSAQKPIALKSDRSWRINKSDSPSSLSSASSFERSLSSPNNHSESSSFLSPKTWSTGAKVNIAERRLAQIQESLRRNRESPSCSSGLPKDPLVHGLESATKSLKPKGSVAGADDDLHPKKLTKKHIYVKPPEKQPIDTRLPKLKETRQKESPSKQPSCSSTPSPFPDKNLAARRLARFQQQLMQQRVSTPSAESPALPQPLVSPIQTSNLGQAFCSESISKEGSCQERLSIGRATTSFTVKEEVGNDVEEQMDWEPTDHELNDMIMEIQVVRTHFQGDDLILKQSSPNFDNCMTSEKSKFFLVLDSNFLMGHLKVVEALRDRQFRDLEPLVLILPWVVIQELDKLKDWKFNRKNDGHTATAASLARTAVKWINLQLQGKHPRVKGQTSFNRTESTLACSVADDCILACCKEMEPFAENVVLLTEDINLSNKAHMLDIQVLNQSQLKARLNKLNQQQRSGSSTSQSNTFQNVAPHSLSNVLAEKVVSKEESNKSDMILCEVKIHVRNYLDEVVQIKMKEVYGDLWMKTFAVPLPWLGLSEVVQFIIEKWMAVFGFACRDRKNLSMFQELLAFLKDKKAYNHSLKEVDRFIGSCIDIVKCLSIKPNWPVQEGCLNSLEQLRDLCKNLPPKPLSSVGDFEADRVIIEKPLHKIWNDLECFCFKSCEFLKIEHDIRVPLEIRQQTVDLNLEQIRSALKQIYSQFRNVIYFFDKLLETPAEQLTTENLYLQGLHRTLTQLSIDLFSSEQFPSIESLAVFCKNLIYRTQMAESIKKFWYFNHYLKLISAF